jgi:hypothetical protein
LLTSRTRRSQSSAPMIGKRNTPKIKRSSLPGQGAHTGALPLFCLPTAPTDSQSWRFSLRPFVCLRDRFRNRIDWYRVCPLFCSVANHGSLRFGLMIRVDRAGSKLCACSTRHVPPRALLPSAGTQLGKGSEAPRCIPSCRASRQVEPVAGSTPPAVRR